jgi:hypothetical protein
MKEISRWTERRRSVTQNNPVKENIPVMKKQGYRIGYKTQN